MDQVIVTSLRKNPRRCREHFIGGILPRNPNQTIWVLTSGCLNAFIWIIYNSWLNMTVRIRVWAQECEYELNLFGFSNKHTFPSILLCLDLCSIISYRCMGNSGFQVTLCVTMNQQSLCCLLAMSTGRFQPLMRIQRRVTHPNPSNVCLTVLDLHGFSFCQYNTKKKKVILSTCSEILALLKPVADIPLTSEGPRFKWWLLFFRAVECESLKRRMTAKVLPKGASTIRKAKVIKLL